MSTNLKQLKSVVYRLTATLGITSIASFLRLGMCILQIYSLKGNEHVWSVSLSKIIIIILIYEYIERFPSIWFTMVSFCRVYSSWNVINCFNASYEKYK